MAELKTQQGLIVGLIPEEMLQEKPEKEPEPVEEKAPAKTRKSRVKE